MINVHSYESMGTFDGPGLRLVVFLQGCPFRCLYCANPDTIDVKGGTPTTPEEILQMAISQKAFFGKKGGITFSGGEPTLQAEALIPLFKELKANVIVSALPDVTAAIVNNNYALDFGLSASDAIFADDRLDIEDYWNLIAARTADLSDPDKVEIFRKVVEAYQSDATLEVFNTECRGFYTPAGWDQDLLPQT